MSKQNFKIAFVGLKLGEHHFKFEVDDRFFEDFEKSPVQKAELEIKVSLEKKSSFMVLLFQIDGFINIPCDRCSDEFDLEIMDDHKIFVKFDDALSTNNLNDEDDIIYLKRNETHLVLDQLIYELSLLSLPIKKACPLNKNENPSCGKEIHHYFTTESENQNNTQTPDPRWEALKKLNK